MVISCQWQSLEHLKIEQIVKASPLTIEKYFPNKILCFFSDHYTILKKCFEMNI
jgi:hypothetical protein